MKRPIVALAVSTASMLVLAACGGNSSASAPASSSSNSAKNVTITIGTFPDPRPMGIVKEEGWLEKQGYTVKWETFLNGIPGEIAAAAGGSLDMGQADTSGMMPLFVKDPTLAWYVGTETGDVVQIIARKGSGITSVAGLKGKVITTPGLNTADQVVLDLALHKAGLPLNAGTYPIATGPNSVIAMQNGTVDAASAYVPFSAQMIVNGTGRLIATADQVYGKPWVAGGLFVTRAFAKAHPQAVRDVLKAVLRAENLIKTQPATAYKLLSQYSGASVAAIKYSYDHNFIRLLPLVPDKQAMIAEAKTEQQYGVFSGNPTTFINSWVNTSFAAAVAGGKP